MNSKVLLEINSQEHINFLENEGYEFIHQITLDDANDKIIVIVDDSKKTVMPASETCLATMKKQHIYNIEAFTAMLHEDAGDVLEC